MQKTLLLTRSIEDNLELEESLRQYNFRFILCPLIEYIDLKFEPSLLKNYSDIIITSKHAAMLCVHGKQDIGIRDIKINAWVVGSKSAEILRSAGFIVKYIAETVEDLLANLPPNIYNRAIYLSSNEITTALPPAIRRQIIYKVKYLDSLKLEQLEAINKGLDYILLYSKNCARTLLKLFKQYNLLKLMENTILITVSLKVAKEVKTYFKNVVYCDGDQYNKIKELLINYAKDEK